MPQARSLEGLGADNICDYQSLHLSLDYLPLSMCPSVCVPLCLVQSGLIAFSLSLSMSIYLYIYIYTSLSLSPLCLSLSLSLLLSALSLSLSPHLSLESNSVILESVCLSVGQRSGPLQALAAASRLSLARRLLACVAWVAERIGSVERIATRAWPKHDST